MKPSAAVSEHESSPDDQKRKPHVERGRQSGSGGREEEAEREETENPGAEHEPAADAERGDLAPQLEHRQLGLEPSERGRTLRDLVDRPRRRRQRGWA